MKKQSWWELLFIQAGGTLCLPVIMVGQLIFQKYGWLAAMLSLGIGNLFLLFLGLKFVSLSSKEPKTTVEQATSYFGGKGRILFSSLMMISMLGWFGIQLNVMSLSLEHILKMWEIQLDPLLINISLGALLSATMCLGMKGMKWLSTIAMPLMMFTLFGAFYLTNGELPSMPPLSLSFLGGVSLIIGANIAAVIDLPTFLQFARSSKDARLCILLLYGLITPLIEAIGVFLSALSGGKEVLSILQSGGGFIWMIWVSFFVLFAGWTTNNTNLYSAIASSYSLSNKTSSVQRTLILGAIGTLFACLNPLGNIEIVLTLIGISISAMGAVMISNYFLMKNENLRNTRYSFLSWIIGLVVGIATYASHLMITGVPALDAFILSIITQKIFNRSRYERINFR